MIEDLLALRHAEEARALLERFGAELRHLFQLAAGGERAVLLAVGDDVLCRRGVQAGHLLQKRRGGRIEVDADGIDTIFHHGVQCSGQLLLRHIMLILADADGLRVDLHELRQRILQTARDGDCGAEIDIVLREFLGGEL